MTKPMFTTERPDYLRFFGVHDKPYMVGWAGPWPPPESLWMGVGLTTGYVNIMDDAASIAPALTVAKVYEFKLGKHSKLVEGPDGTLNSKLGNFVVRGAEYELVREVLG